MTFWQRAKHFPPILCRLLARQRYGGPLSTLQIAQRGGLSPASVEALSQSATWDVPLDSMRKFLVGCNLDFCDADAMRRVDDYLRKTPTFRYLRGSPEWESYYQPLLRRWRAGYGTVKADSPFWPPLRELLMRLNSL